MNSGLRLVGQGVWAIVDQALFAGASFVLNLLLARWLGPAEYGVFGVAFTVFLLLGFAHTALVIEPLLVFGSGQWLTAFRAYLQQALKLLVAVSIGGAAALVLGSLVVDVLVGDVPVVPVLMTLAWTGPFVILQWTMRRACYVLRRPDIAAAGGLLYLVLLLGAAVFVRSTVGLDARTAFIVMAGASLLVAAFLAWRLLALYPVQCAMTEPPSLTSVWWTHWLFGRWVLASSLLGWLSADVFYIILLPQHGYAAAGTVRAAYVLVLPVLHVITALSTVALPWFVGARRSASLRRPTLLLWGGLTALAGLYAVVLELTAGIAIRLVYGESFADVQPLVRLFALLPIATATSAAFATVLRSMERSRDLFVAAVVAAVVGAGLGVPLTWWYGEIGLVAAMLLESTVYSVAVGWRLRRAVRLETLEGRRSV